MANNKKNSDKLMSPAVLITLIVCGIVLIGMIVLAVVAKSGVFKEKEIALKVGDDEINSIEYSYYYATSTNNFIYSNYSFLSYLGYDYAKSPSQQTTSFGELSWPDYFARLATESAAQTSILYQESQKAGFEMDPAEVKTTVDDYMASVKESASYYGYSVAGYLTALYGKGMTADRLASYLEKALKASAYAEKIESEITVSDADAEAFKNENLSAYTEAAYRYYTVSFTTDDEKAAAMTNVRSLMDAVNEAKGEAGDVEAGAAAFESFVKGLSGTEDTETDRTLFEGTILNAPYESVQEWLMDGNRAAGDMTYFEEPTSYYVCYYLSSALLDYKLQNVRHILVLADEDGDGETTEGELSTAQKKIAQIEAEYNAGEKTEAAFSALAVAHSEDSGSASDGGLISNMTRGTYVQPFEDWAFDASRKAGDTGIVESSYGYHLMYYVSEGDVYWKADAVKSLISSRYQEKYNLMAEGYTITQDEKLIAEAAY